MKKLIKQFEALVNQLQLFTGIHTAEAALIASLDNRLSALENDHDALSRLNDNLHGRVIDLSTVMGEHLHSHSK